MPPRCSGRRQVALSAITYTSFIHLVTPRRKQRPSGSHQPRKPHPTTHNMLSYGPRRLVGLFRMQGRVLRTTSFLKSFYPCITVNKYLHSDQPRLGVCLATSQPITFILGSLPVLLGEWTLINVVRLMIYLHYYWEVFPLSVVETFETVGCSGELS